jgi:hypothetical protein
MAAYYYCYVNHELMYQFVIAGGRLRNANVAFFHHCPLPIAHSPFPIHA